MLVVETRAFTRGISRAMADEVYRTLQIALVARPDPGTPIPSGGGLRKIRWGAEGAGSVAAFGSSITGRSRRM